MPEFNYSGLFKSNKVRGLERVMMRDAMRQYAKANHLTLAEVHAQQRVKRVKHKRRGER